MAQWLIIVKSVTVILVSVGLIACSEPDKQSTSMYGGLLDQEKFTSEHASKDIVIKFPEDHLSHPEFAIEWWYLTANLFDSTGKQYPLQWTLFRFSGGDTHSTWSDGQLYMSHGKLSSKTDNWFEENFAKGGVGNADVKMSNKLGGFTAYLDDWLWRSSGTDLFPATLKFNLNNKAFISLQLDTTGPYILNGQSGFSAKLKNEEHASMYYSQPFIQIKGTISLPDDIIEVSGRGWFDHEWSAGLSDQDTLGWDWFSLHLDDGQKLMLYQVRHKTLGPSWFGSLISPEGQKIHLTENDISAKIDNNIYVESHTGVENLKIPLEWSFVLPEHHINITVTPFKNDQYNHGVFPYYEGAVNFSGSHKGVGFMELTGY